MDIETEMWMKHLNDCNIYEFNRLVIYFNLN